mmetsp:Transcript_98307/g.306738  ORF Transcript_98307/g.306738 Transcript_98307/m.306738 type:complete len:126 (-) Transcript_98307:91-468(-)
MLPEAARAQQQQAKQLIKTFVKEMVKGKKHHVLAPSGDLKTCTVSLSRNLDSLRLKMGSTGKDIALADVAEIRAGSEVEGIKTPLDELCATLLLGSGGAISFRFGDIEARDTFILCVGMFADKQR